VSPSDRSASIASIASISCGDFSKDEFGSTIENSNPSPSVLLARSRWRSVLPKIRSAYVHSSVKSYPVRLLLLHPKDLDQKTASPIKIEYRVVELSDLRNVKFEALSYNWVLNRSSVSYIVLVSSPDSRLLKSLPVTLGNVEAVRVWYSKGDVLIPRGSGSWR
jgi:hypothetical protein